MYLEISISLSVPLIIQDPKKCFILVEITTTQPAAPFIVVICRMRPHLTQLMVNGWKNLLMVLLHHKESNIPLHYVSSNKKKELHMPVIYLQFLKKIYIYTVANGDDILLYGGTLSEEVGNITASSIIYKSRRFE